MADLLTKNGYETQKQILVGIKAREVTWQMVEAKTHAQRDYQRWRREYKKVADQINRYEWNLITEQNKAEYELRVKGAKAKRIQVLADDLHAVLCTHDHTDRCDYHYGNWQNDVRVRMLDFYDKAKALIERKGELTAFATVYKLEEANKLREELTNL